MKVGVDANGIRHGICTDINRINEIVKLGNVNNGTNVSNARSPELIMSRTALQPTEMPFSFMEYKLGMDLKNPSKLLVTQYEINNKVTDLSENLSLPQMKEAAIQMAIKYATNYKDGPVEIRGDKPVMADLLHAALLRLLPGVTINNYVLDSESPTFNNPISRNWFVNRQFSNGDNAFKDAEAEIAWERARLKELKKGVSEVNKEHDNKLDEGFFGRNREKVAAIKEQVQASRKEKLDKLADVERRVPGNG